MFYIYFPSDKKYFELENHDLRKTKDWKHSLRALKITFFYLLILTLISTWVISTGSSSPMATAIWTTLLAFIALIASSVQFIPQILRTFQLKVVGALSIPAMLMQTPGSFLFCITIATSPGTNITSWITYFVGGCLQGALLALCIYYQMRPPHTQIEYMHIDAEVRRGDAINAPESDYPNLQAIEAKAEQALLGEESDLNIK